MKTEYYSNVARQLFHWALEEDHKKAVTLIKVADRIEDLYRKHGHVMIISLTSEEMINQHRRNREHLSDAKAIAEVKGDKVYTIEEAEKILGFNLVKTE